MRQHYTEANVHELEYSTTYCQLTVFGAEKELVVMEHEWVVDSTKQEHRAVEWTVNETDRQTDRQMESIRITTVNKTIKRAKTN